MKKRKIKVQDTASKMIEKFKSSQDPNGSYTGTSIDNGRPVQDADDL